MARVTVVMRTFERPVLLARAIASVRNQEFTDWQLVIVNNGGHPAPVDETVRVARAGLSAGEITVIHLPEPVGMERASNEGLRATSSEFFAIHDDDDTWAPGFLSVMVPRLGSDSGAVAAVSGLTKVNETMKGSTVRPVREDPFWLVPGRLTFRGMIGHNTFPPIAALFRRSVLDTVGMFDESLPVLGDWEFNLRAVRAGRFLHEPRVLARYHVRTPESDRQSSNSIIGGADLHRSVKLQLQDRWLGEDVDGVNKGQLSIQAQTATDVEDLLGAGTGEIANRTVEMLRAGSIPRRVLRALRNPRRALRAAGRVIRG